MLVFIGDIHGDFLPVNAIQNKFLDPNTIFIQVGDFGYWPYLAGKWERGRTGRPVYFIDGNHDYLPTLRKLDTVTEVWPDAFYVPRGSVLTLDGKKIAFMGGAGSVDKAWRQPGLDWFSDEQITKFDIDRLITNLSIDGDPNNLQKVDFLVTHTPPDNCIQANFDPAVLENFFNLPRTWRDPSAFEIESLSNRLGNPQIICGHMHRSVDWQNVKILNINSWFNVE